jgi:hypothetical protein
MTYQILFLLMSLVIGSSAQPPPTKCDIANILVGEELDSESKVLSRHGAFTSASVLFRPSEMEVGEYDVLLTRRTTNIYKIANTETHIETRHCFRSGLEVPARIYITDTKAFNKGYIVFK